jgi:hypothetical protein
VLKDKGVVGNTILSHKSVLYWNVAEVLTDTGNIQSRAANRDRTFGLAGRDYGDPLYSPTESKVI